MVLMTPVGSGIRGQHLPLALVRRAGDAHPGLEDRDAEQPARRLRPDALGHRRSEPGHVPGAQGAAAREGRRRASASRASRTTSARSSKMIDAPLGDRSKWRPEWPDVKDCFVPIGKARVCRAGRERDRRDVRAHGAGRDAGRRAGSRARASRSRSSTCGRLAPVRLGRHQGQRAQDATACSSSTRTPR